MPFGTRLAILAVFISAVTPASAASKNSWTFENTDLKIRIIARTGEQMAAFYEARGFPKNAVAKLSQFCFFTVGIANKSNDIILLDLDKWSFASTDKNFRRYHRDTLKQYWLDIGLEKRLISTFRWTLLPEQLDFRPAEREGGNIVVSRTTEAFNIKAVFSRPHSSNIKVKINNLRCAGKQ